MAGFGSKGDIIPIKMTFYSSEKSTEGVAVPCLFQVTDEDGLVGNLLPAPGSNFPEFVTSSEDSYSPPDWTDVCTGFFEPLLDELETWLKRPPAADCGKDSNHGLLQDLLYELLPIACRCGAQCRVDSWERAEARLSVRAPGVLPIFRARVVELTEEVTRAIDELAAMNSDRLPFLAMQVGDFCGFLRDLQESLLSLKEGVPTDEGLLADGPHHPYTWQKNGKLIEDQMQPITWQLVDYLWKARGKTASFDELAEPVFGDRAEEISVDRIGKQRSCANRFLKTHKISWRLSLDSRSRRIYLSPEKTPAVCDIQQ